MLTNFSIDDHKFIGRTVTHFPVEKFNGGSEAFWCLKFIKTRNGPIEVVWVIWSDDFDRFVLKKMDVFL